MDPSQSPARASRARLLVFLAALVVVGSTLGLVAFVWYPTTHQPAIALTDAGYTVVPCAPVPGGYANRYDVTFTLTNSGQADGRAAVQFLLDGNSMGYQDFFVGRESQVEETGRLFGEVRPSAANCGDLGTPAVSLASVARVPPIDDVSIVRTTVSLLSFLGFLGLLGGVLYLEARRRGVALLEDLGSEGWFVGLGVASAAYFFSNVVAILALTPYNVPPDWTLGVVFGLLYGAVGIAAFLYAWRCVARRAGGPAPA